MQSDAEAARPPSSLWPIMEYHLPACFC